MSRWITRSISLALGAALLAGIVWAFLPKPVPVDLAKVCKGALAVSVDEDGKTRLRDRYVVSSPLGGRLLRVVLRPGDAVKQGETIVASIEPTDPALLDARTVAEADLRVKSAEVTLRKAGPDIERAKAALALAEADHRRARDLRQRGTLALQELENLAYVERSRAEELKSARLAEEIARFELELAKAALLRTRSTSDPRPTGDDLQFQIRSPISGKVLRVFQESSTVITPGLRLLELGEPTDLELEIDVLSTDAVKISNGARVLVEQWGGDRPLNGRVRLVEPSGFTKISALGVEEQRVNAIIDLVDPREDRATLGDGFRVEARIITWETAEALKVPTSALFRRGDEWSTFVVRDGKAVLQQVRIGHSNGIEAEVLEGLADGDNVVLHPSDRVANGVTILVRAQ